MLLVFAILLGFIALLAPLSRKLFMAEEGDLKSFAGSVQRAPTQDSKGLIRIRVETSDGPHDLLVEDRSHLSANHKLASRRLCHCARAVLAR
jgi:hypothetical protein